MPKVYIKTFGCQMNNHDTEVMSGLLEREGYYTIEEAEEADIIILNTCSVREKAEHKVYSELGKYRELKKRKKCLIIGVGGCVGRQEGKNLIKRMPCIDIVFGPENIDKLPWLINGVIEKRSGRAIRGRISSDSISKKRNAKISSLVSIMQGCDNFCSYCVVPFTRGREKSRPSQDIISEITGLAGDGCREVILLGQNVNSYGRGLDEDIDFPSLLYMIHDIQELARIRFITSHPKDLSERLIDAMADLPNVCEHIHLPLQSGSNNILEKMNRRYDYSDYIDRVKKLRDKVRNVSITSDIIVGFPGESHCDFMDTIRALKEIRFDNIYAFKFSKRPNTAAMNIDGQIPEDVKKERLQEVISLQKEITLNKNREFIGRIEEILVEGESKNGKKMLTGKTLSNRIVNFEGEDNLIASICHVKINEFCSGSLRGDICY
ncbi:MAG: tRNA (N6-isopentenyl adenosine(37)-C2)-methylthiotransferase MiaB [Nitrospirota bacterium]